MRQLSNDGKSVTEILSERASVYGSYAKGVEVRAAIVEVMTEKYLETHDDTKLPELRIMFSDLALKLMRFAAEPKYEDSLQDLQGYAKLINDTIQGRDMKDKHVDR